MSEASRPRSVTIVALVGILLGLWNLWRAVTLIQQVPLLSGLASYPDPRLRLGFALLWTLLFVPLGVAIWWRRPVTRWLFPLSFLLYSVYHLLLLAFFVRAAPARQGWPATVVIFLSVLLWSLWVLRRPAHRRYWRQE